MLTYLLNKNIIFEKETNTVNSVGTPVESWEFFKESYASVRQIAGTTEFSEMGALPYTNVEFMIRFDDRVGYHFRVLYNDEYYKIKHITVDGRKDWQRLQCIVWEDE